MSDIGAAAGIRGNEGQVLGYKNNVLQAVTLNGPPFIPAPFGSVNSGDLGPSGANSRTVGAIYQNTGGKPIMVIANMSLFMAQTNADTDSAYAAAFVDSVTPPVAGAGDVYWGPGVVLTAVGGGEIDSDLIFFVPVDWYYEVSDLSIGKGSIVVDTWWEIQ